MREGRRQLQRLAIEWKAPSLLDVIEHARGSVYCTELFVSPPGFLGNRHKLMPAAAGR